MKYIVFILFGIYLSGCTSIPAEYVGDWGNSHAWLTIKGAGGLKYVRRQSSMLGGDKTTTSEWGIQKITNKEISGLLPFVSISIEGPPKTDENGSIFLLVEGSKLYRTAYRSSESDESEDLLDKILHNEFCKAIPGSWTHSDCD